MDSLIKPKVATVSSVDAARGEVVIPRSRDGHYYVSGSINGQAVTFMVDTGASTVFVGAEMAQRTGMPRGVPARFKTAGGEIAGETVAEQTIEAGGIRIAGLSVAVALRMDTGGYALLGQNFLRYVDVIQSGDQMILRVKSGSATR